MIEIHPFGNFVPANTQYLILGSFPGKRTKDDINNGNVWFYGSKRNQFWPIMEKVYGLSLKSKIEKRNLFTKLGIAITDIILSCERKFDNNLDMNLTNIVFNRRTIIDILEKNHIKAIFFTSRFVEKLFRRHFKNVLPQYSKIRLVTLPSPSPRYAVMSRQEKIEKYRSILPKLK